MSVLLLETGQSVLVGPTADDAPWRMNVDVVQEGHVTLATVDDEHLPSSWSSLDEVHITLLDRDNVHLLPVRSSVGAGTASWSGRPARTRRCNDALTRASSIPCRQASCCSMPARTSGS